MMELVVEGRPLPVGSAGTRSFGWWGIVSFIVTEAALFAYLEFTYLYYFLQLGSNLGSEKLPDFTLSLPMTVALVLNSIAMWSADRNIRRNATTGAAISLVVGLLLVVAFGVLEILDWRTKEFALNSNVYSSSYFVLTGFHFAHVIVGIVGVAVVISWLLLGYLNTHRNVPVIVVTIYWHFTDAIWVTLFGLFYILPYISH